MHREELTRAVNEQLVELGVESPLFGQAQALLHDRERRTERALPQGLVDRDLVPRISQPSRTRRS